MTQRYLRLRSILGLAALCFTFNGTTHATDREPAGRDIAPTFLALQLGDAKTIERSIGTIRAHWHRSLVPFALDSLYLLRDERASQPLVQLLEAESGLAYGHDAFAWWQWLWQQPELVHREYGDFKSVIYGLIDPRFKSYFGDQRATSIRLDEVVWGGVRQDGIPPLRNPTMVNAGQASYLDDSDVVFGIAINGDVRAYPQRILAWHEMFVDVVGGKAVAGVY